MGIRQMMLPQVYVYDSDERQERGETEREIWRVDGVFAMSDG
jgi:hypothetical protein